MTGYIWPPNQHIPSTWAVSTETLKHAQEREAWAQKLAATGLITYHQAVTLINQAARVLPRKIDYSDIYRIVEAIQAELDAPLPHHTVSLARINHHWKEKPL